MLDVGPHGIMPENCPPSPQQALLAVVNPANLFMYHKNLCETIYLAYQDLLLYKGAIENFHKNNIVPIKK